MKNITNIVATLRTKTAFLIGDSQTEGKNQVISDTLFFKTKGFGEQRKYSSELDDQRDENALKNAEKTAKEGNYQNIRLVTVTKVAKTTRMGIICWIEKKRETKPFNF